MSLTRSRCTGRSVARTRAMRVRVPHVCNVLTTSRGATLTMGPGCKKRKLNCVTFCHVEPCGFLYC
uniref:Uncharacterized protein n=1 Tax=Arundo donax TaxID=35708 RepID=A0A0A9E5J5_ARUDO